MSIKTLRLRWAPVVALAVAAAVVASAEPASAATYQTYSYEQGLSGWQMGYAGDGEWSMARSTDWAYSGRYSIECYLDGATGTGTAWLAHRYRVPMDTLVEVNLTFQLWSAQQSDVNQWPVVGYLGTSPPTSAADFEIIGYTGEVAGWQQYQFQRLQLSGQWPASIWVAFGISATWEFQREYYMDYVTVNLTP